MEKLKMVTLVVEKAHPGNVVTVCDCPSTANEFADMLEERTGVAFVTVNVGIQRTTKDFHTQLERSGIHKVGNVQATKNRIKARAERRGF